MDFLAGKPLHKFIKTSERMYNWNSCYTLSAIIMGQQMLILFTSQIIILLAKHFSRRETATAAALHFQRHTRVFQSVKILSFVNPIFAIFSVP
jgi:ABC-type tungstate transport system substrate-binding protein